MTSVGTKQSGWVNDYSIYMCERNKYKNETCASITNKNTLFTIRTANQSKMSIV